MRENDEIMDYITFACKKKADMHEHIDFVTDGIAGRAGFYFSLYFTDLINKALASKTSTEDHLELDFTLTADEKTYTMNDSDALLSAVKSLTGKSFTADITCDGMCGAFRVSMTTDEDGSILDEEVIDYGVWSSDGLYSFLSRDIMKDAKFTYKNATFYPDSGSFFFGKIIDGKPVNISNDYSEDIISVKKEDYAWWSFSLALIVDFDYEKYPGILSALRECTKKYLSENEYSRLEQSWADEDIEPGVLLNSAYFLPGQLSELQDYFDELNTIIEPIKDEVYASADGYLDVAEDFAVAEIGWYDGGFHVFGVEY